MTPQDQIACHRLQLEGLKSWPESFEKNHMTQWVLNRISKLEREVN